MSRRARWIIATYLLLLATSNVVRHLHPPHHDLLPGQSAVQLKAVDGERLTGHAVRLAYFEEAPADNPEAPVLLLLHGSPGDHREVRGLAHLLAGSYRVLAPDLPGFGASDHRIPDYSFHAHARYLLQLLDSLNIPRAHVLGFSMGGGVALSMASLAPQRVQSLVLLSAIGAQEYELLGNYELNHALHGLQLAGLWLLLEAVPHMGYFDDVMLDLPYARNFFDSDQRPLRGILQRYEGPLLIIHGEHDPLVAPAAAREHERLVPQSRLLMVPGDHFMAFARPDELAPPIAEFIGEAQAGRAPVRAMAAPARIARAAEPFDPSAVPGTSGFALVLLLALIAAATLVSEDLTCIMTGLLVARGTVGYGAGTAACLIGIVAGDLLLFAAGRVLGRAVVARAPLRWFLDEPRIAISSAWITRRGPRLVISSRFLPGTRLPTYFAAGLLRTNGWRFTLYFLVAAVLWTPLLVGLAAVFGEALLRPFLHFEMYALPVLLTIGLGLWLILRFVLPLFSFRGRRLLLSRWRRVTRWEFWPPWAFYPPIVLYILWLSFKHRSLTLFTAVNPVIPGGGFAGESKWAILGGLGDSPEWVARTGLIKASLPARERLAAAEAFLRAERLEFPVVLKPDIGERGSGVAVVRSREALEGYLARAGGDILIQEYVPGLEFGVFYYRLPGEEHGRIFSITEKRFPSVRGDGTSTLEELILRDARAVCMARFFLARHAPRLGSVPPKGTEVPLVELGTHCRGSAFYDGGWVETPALAAAIDRITRRYQGFFFGRYDIRTGSVAAFREGRDFKVIELNGATSEATSIYDPKNGLCSAYRTLAKQWGVLFAIADRNRALGVTPMAIGAFLQMLGRHRRAVQAHIDV